MIILIVNELRGSSMYNLICYLGSQNYARKTYATFICSYWLVRKEGRFLLAVFQVGAFSPCCSPIWKLSYAALCIFQMCRSCSVCKWNVVEAAQFTFEDESNKIFLNGSRSAIRRCREEPPPIFECPWSRLLYLYIEQLYAHSKSNWKLSWFCNLSIGNSNLLHIEQRVLKKIKYQASYFKIKSIRMTTLQSDPKLAILSL
jgi:hypothetical protein